MELHHGRPRAAWPTLRARSLTFALAVLLVGCSTQRLPVTPTTGISSGPASPAGGVMSGGKQTVVITLAPDQDASTVANAYGATVIKNGWRVAGLKPRVGETADQLVCDLQRDVRVLTAEKNAPIEAAEMRQKSWAFDDGCGSPDACEYQPATSSCNLSAALQKSTGQGVLVAVLDTGGELTHPWLQGRIAGGIDFVDGDNDPSDVPDGLDNDGDGYVDEGWGHGTHVAGIVGIAAPDAKILLVRVLDSDGRGDMLSVAQGIRWAVANGAKVLNLSLGSSSKSDAVKLALDEAANAGVIAVAAAGNSGTPDSVEFPANYKAVMAVTAIDCEDRVASFSSTGSQVSICAAGVAIRSSYRNGGYALWSGTSMASPWVAGGVALVIAKNPTWPRNKVMDQIESTGRAIWRQNPSLRIGLGGGALDLGAALSDAPIRVIGQGT